MRRGGEPFILHPNLSVIAVQLNVEALSCVESTILADADIERLSTNLNGHSTTECVSGGRAYLWCGSGFEESTKMKLELFSFLFDDSGKGDQCHVCVLEPCSLLPQSAKGD